MDDDDGNMMIISKSSKYKPLWPTFKYPPNTCCEYFWKIYNIVRREYASGATMKLVRYETDHLPVSPDTRISSRHYLGNISIVH